MADTYYIQIKCDVSPLIMGREVVTAVLAEEGFESFEETQSGLNAYIPLPEFKEQTVGVLNELSQGEMDCKFEVVKLKDENWNAQWESQFQPVEIGKRLSVRAPFHDPSNAELEIIVNPKMAFGTGHHQTTFLMAQKLLNSNVRGKKVLDMGCGTGVLGILAAKLKASEVLGIDIDPWSTENTEENAELNSVKMEVLLGGAEVIPDLKFDLIMANINRNILTRDMPQYVKALKERGEIWFSGFYANDNNVIQNCAKSLGLKLVSSEVREDWSLLCFAIEPGV